VQPRLLRLNAAPHIGRLAQAAADAEWVLAVDPNNAKVQQQWVSFLEKDSRHAEMEQACRRLLQRQPNHAGLLYFLAKAYHFQGKDEEAAAILDRVIPANPGYADPQILRGILYQESGKNAEAIPLLRQGLAKNPAHSLGRYHLAQALTRTGQDAEAKKEMEAFLEQEKLDRLLVDVKFQPNNLELQTEAAATLLNNGRAKEGIDLLKKVLARDPNHEAARQLLAAHSESRGR
jgi:predicted Zn-dependent protease